MNPATPADAPDPARSYERAKPAAESGQGRLDNNDAIPADQPDQQNKAVRNSHPPRQINADDVVDERATAPAPKPADKQPDHSMLEEEPDGWDLAPASIPDPRQKRHPRTEGKGGTE